MIPAAEIRGDFAATLRYVFLHLPTASHAAGTVESIAVVTKSDLLAASAPGGARVTIRGEVRDVMYGSGDRLACPVDVPAGAELWFGVSTLPDAARVQAQVTVTVDGRTSTVFSSDVTGPGWHDFRSPLAAAKRAVVRLISHSDPPGATVLWSSPVVVAQRTQFAPNVVLYVVDALRADRLGVYGGKTRSSPFLDEFARQGLVFERAYAAASWTKPSVATLLTGLFPPTHGLGSLYYTDPLPDAAPTLQSRLRARGYLTAQFSANAFTGTLSNLDRGFDQTLTPSAFAASGMPGGKIGAAALNDRIVPWLDAHVRDTFFLYIQSIEPHEPRAIAPPGADPFAAYDGELAVNDRAIGRLYQHLVDLHLAEHTLFIVTSDHGEAFGEHGRRGHGVSVYEEEVRVPLVVRWPGVVRPGVVADPASLVDVVPTVLEYCGVPFDRAEFQGRSLVPGSRAGQLTRPVFATRFVYPDDLSVEGADHVESRAIIDFPWKVVATDAGPDSAPRAVQSGRRSVRTPESRDGRRVACGAHEARSDRLPSGADGGACPVPGRLRGWGRRWSAAPADALPRSARAVEESRVPEIAPGTFEPCSRAQEPPFSLRSSFG